MQRLGEEARRKTSPARVPDWARQYVSLEANATEIKLFFGDFVPGMVQTRDYARALPNVTVQVAHGADWTAVRDSKDKPGPVLVVADGEWDAFIGTAGTFIA
ncbi:MAG TPA: Scr1 family TA system antitoxin-like transcriptional regulator [Pseudonocardiaceae bacterium]|nr:Scr1 family TA system antitoxin-like transcriptional regulator [Pseudonocardiaceae bacterium]